MFITPQETQALRSFRTDRVRQQLERLWLENELHRFSQNEKVFFLTDEHTEVKPFVHPITIERPAGGSDNHYGVAIDARGFAKVNRETGELTGGADLQFFQLYATTMVELWFENRSEDLLSISDFPIRIFAGMMSENIGTRLNLEDELRMMIRIFAAYYYITLHLPDVSFDDRDRLGFAKRITRTTGALTDEVLTILDEIEPMRTLDDFISRLIDYTGSERLQQLSTGVLYNRLGGIWFGVNATEQVAVALEYPPTWAAMTYMTLSHRGYQKTVLSKLIKTLDRKGELGQHFIRSMNYNLWSDR